MDYYGDEQYGDEHEMLGEVIDVEALTADIQ